MDCGRAVYIKNKYSFCSSCYQKSPDRMKVSEKIVTSRPSYNGQANPNYKGKINLKCRCGNEFSIFPSLLKTENFCSRPCKHKYSVSQGKSEIYNGVQFRSRWEAAFAKWADENGLTWKYEPIKIPYESGYYIPDFWIEEWDSYVEVKGYWREDSKAKFDYVSQFYKIKLVNKQWFLDHGFTVSCKKGIYK